MTGTIMLILKTYKSLWALPGKVRWLDFEKSQQHEHQRERAIEDISVAVSTAHEQLVDNSIKIIDGNVKTKCKGHPNWKTGLTQQFHGRR